MKQQKIAYSIMAILMLYVIATAFAIADESVTIEDSIATETSENATEFVSNQVTDNQVTDEIELSEVTSETETLAPEILAPTTQQRYAGIVRATLSRGFVVKSDNSAAEKFGAFWVSVRYISVDATVVRNLTKQYRGQPQKLREELAKLAVDDVVAISAGRIHIGHWFNGERYKILKKEFTNTSVSFYVFPITENLALLRNATDQELSSKSIGTLTATAIKYPHLTVWQGTLTLNSGKFTGTWQVTASSHSRVMSKGAISLAKTKASERKIEKAERKEIKNETSVLNVAKPVRRGFFARLFRSGRE